MSISLTQLEEEFDLLEIFLLDEGKKKKKKKQSNITPIFYNPNPNNANVNQLIKAVENPRQLLRASLESQLQKVNPKYRESIKTTLESMINKSESLYRKKVSLFDVEFSRFAIDLLKNAYKKLGSLQTLSQEEKKKGGSKGKIIIGIIILTIFIVLAAILWAKTKKQSFTTALKDIVKGTIKKYESEVMNSNKPTLIKSFIIAKIASTVAKVLIALIGVGGLLMLAKKILKALKK